MTKRFEPAAALLQEAVSSGTVQSASLYVRAGTDVYERRWGAAAAPQSRFYIASISKTMTVASLMVFYDRGELSLDEPVVKYLPEFNRGLQAKVTVRQLLTHVSGLPDQLPNNQELRSSHAPLQDFIAHALKLEPHFEPGSQYEYSSMAILLAAEIAQRLSKMSIHEWMQKSVFEPLEMQSTSLGLGSIPIHDVVKCQVEFAAPESGGGDPASKSWDWNSEYWLAFGAPWGGVLSTAVDVGKFMYAFLHPEGRMLKRETAALMIQNQLDSKFPPRGLGFQVGNALGGKSRSARTFGHTGSTGTICWADPEADLLCVILTSLPARTGKIHPRDVASRLL